VRRMIVQGAPTQAAEDRLRQLQQSLSRVQEQRRQNFPYRSGAADWVKVKCLSWREANKDRGELFNKRKRR
jgi:hypothetical protein